MHIQAIARLAKIVWTRYERYRAEIMFYRGPKQVFWMSKKQGLKLKSCVAAMNINAYPSKGMVFGVFDDDRYVWCGCIEEMQEEYYGHCYELRDDLAYMKSHFKVPDKDVDLYESLDPPCLEVPEVVTVDKELMDEA